MTPTTDDSSSTDMARGRMISKSLSTSEKFAALLPLAQDLTEFCQLLYPLLVVHTDDFGRLQGDPFTVKAMCYPASKRTLEEFAAALWNLDRVGLIAWYVVNEKQYIQILAFDSHQSGLHKRTQSTIPSDPKAVHVTYDPDKKQLYQPVLGLKTFPGNSRLREEKGIEEKIPPTPLKQGGRISRAEFKQAATIRSRVYGCCPHDPRCTQYDDCVRAIALARKAKKAES